MAISGDVMAAGTEGRTPRTPWSWAPGLSFTHFVEGMGMNESPRACPLCLGTGPGWCLFTCSHTHGREPGISSVWVPPEAH